MKLSRHFSTNMPLDKNITKTIFTKLKLLSDEHHAITSNLSSLSKNSNHAINLITRQRMLNNSKILWDAISKLHADRKELKEIIADHSNKKDFKKLARDELAEINLKIDNFAVKINQKLLGKNKLGIPSQNRAFLEVTSGVGGLEACYFAYEIFEMYRKAAELKKWKAKTITLTEAKPKALRNGLLEINGENAFDSLRFESGCHRVQRVPSTSRAGMIQTSVAKVTVVPMSLEKKVSVEINKNELKIDTFRSSGPGGQHVNKTESAVRITHSPTGISVVGDSERSQHMNKEKAMGNLKMKLEQLELNKKIQKRNNAMKEQNKVGDRSEKIRTYNWPKQRVVDHRIALSFRNTEKMLKGEYLEKIWENLEEKERQENVKNLDLEGFLKVIDVELINELV